MDVDRKPILVKITSQARFVFFIWFKTMHVLKELCFKIFSVCSSMFFLIFYVNCLYNSINERLHFFVSNVFVPTGSTVNEYIGVNMKKSCLPLFDHVSYCFPELQACQIKCFLLRISHDFNFFTFTTHLPIHLFHQNNANALCELILNSV